MNDKINKLQYPMLCSRLYNVPLAIEQAKLNVIISTFSPRLIEGLETKSSVFFAKEENQVQTGNIALINVFGTLFARSDFGESGSSSYESLRKKIEANIGEGYKSIGLYIDSPGGEVAGLYNFTNYLFSLRENGIRTFSFVDSMAASAAYTIASATEHIYSLDSAFLGSIGIVMTIYEQTKADEKNGYKVLVLRSKEKKQLLNPHEEFSEEKIKESLGMLAIQDEILNKNVNRYRQALPIHDMVAFEGALFTAQSQPALYDTLVMSLDDALGQEQQLLNEHNKGRLMKDQEDKELRNKEMDKFRLEVQEAISCERERCLSIYKASNTYKVNSTLTEKYISNGSPAEIAVDLFTAIAEAAQTLTAVESENGLTETLTGKSKTKLSIVEVEGTVVDIDKIKQELKRGK